MLAELCNQDHHLQDNEETALPFPHSWHGLKISVMRCMLDFRGERLSLGSLGGLIELKGVLQ